MRTTSTWDQAGFFDEKVNAGLAMQRLSAHLDAIPVLFSRYSPENLLEPIAPGKWSRQQLLGHLIDSALNNLKRFTEIQFLPSPYKVVAYRQDDLVGVNYYQQLPLAHLIDLWRSLNRQIIYVVEGMPVEKLESPVDPQYANGELRTLGWIICDYVAHLEHHLGQINRTG